jgi:hypothetical protein
MKLGHKRLGLKRAAASASAATVLAVPIFAATTAESDTGTTTTDPIETTPPPAPVDWEAVAKKKERQLHAERRRSRHRLRLLIRLRRSVRHRVRMGGANGVLAGLLCIHGFEGSWTDPNAPYWGGLQMDGSFMRAYGGEFYRALGTADQWPPVVQLVVGARAVYSGRGFGPWPNTRRLCGI